MRLQARGVGQKNEGDGLGDLFGEGVVEDERVVTTLVGRHIVCPLGDRVRFAFADPLDGLESNRRQLLEGSGLLVAGASVRDCRRQVLVGIRAVGIGGRQAGAQLGRLARMLEEAKVHRLLMRLNAP